MKRNTVIKVILVVLVFSLGLWLYSQDKSKTAEVELGVEADNELLLYFESEYPDNEVLKCGYEDVNDDGRKDLVVIFDKEPRSKGMKVVLDKGNHYEVTEEVPAPIENQEIEFKDIDEKEEIEFIVSGSKDGRFGYAIFRVTGNEVRNLFGEDMDDCC